MVWFGSLWREGLFLLGWAFFLLFGDLGWVWFGLAFARRRVVVFVRRRSCVLIFLLASANC
ncbi:hypothetical protein BCAR13_170001 [Paraburkholderia caribensis]|nr:hypothetical protein BCAR13_170001 [Paraburkholderia caribensis]